MHVRALHGSCMQSEHCISVTLDSRTAIHGHSQVQYMSVCEPSGTWCSSSQGSHQKLKVGQICEECRVKRQQQEGEWEETAVPRTDAIQRSAYGSLFVRLFLSFFFPFFCHFSFFHLFFLPFCHFFSLFLLILYPCCLYPWYCTFMVSAKLRKESWKDGEMKLHWKREVRIPECKLIPPRIGRSVKLKNLMNCRRRVHWVYAVQTDKTDNPASVSI